MAQHGEDDQRHRDDLNQRCRNALHRAVLSSQRQHGTCTERDDGDGGTPGRRLAVKDANALPRPTIGDCEQPAAERYSSLRAAGRANGQDDRAGGVRGQRAQPVPGRRKRTIRPQDAGKDDHQDGGVQQGDNVERRNIERHAIASSGDPASATGPSTGSRRSLLGAREKRTCRLGGIRDRWSGRISAAGRFIYLVDDNGEYVHGPEVRKSSHVQSRLGAAAAALPVCHGSAGTYRAIAAAPANPGLRPD